MLLVFALLLWGAGSAWHYTCRMRDACSTTPAKVDVAKPPAAPAPIVEISAAAPVNAAQAAPAPAPAPEWTSDRPFLFVWGRSDPVPGPPLVAWKDALMQDGADDKVLEIVGAWYAGEKNDPRVGDLGLARAMRVRDLLADRIPAHRIFLRSRSESRATADQRGLFDAVAVRWIGTTTSPTPAAAPVAALAVGGVAPTPRTPPPLQPAAPAAPAAEGAAVVGIAAPGPARAAGEDRVALLFDSGAAINALDSATVIRLRTLLQRAMDNGRTLLVVGHTDSLGDEQGNLALGLQRAQQVRDWLLSDVLPGATPRLRAETLGSFQPVATNDTEDGRRRNRRVEVYLLP